MPVIVADEDWDQWLTADAGEALRLQRQWPDNDLRIVAKGQNKSGN